MGYVDFTVFLRAILCSLQSVVNYGNLLPQVFAKNVVKTTFLIKKLLMSWFDETFFRWEQIFHFFQTQFGYCGNLIGRLPRFLGQNFVKATHLLNKSILLYVLKSWFDGKNFGESNFYTTLHSVEICNFFPHDFFSKIPSNQLFH